jgi:succinoglycan biosynthesis protein ExoH
MTTVLASTPPDSHESRFISAARLLMICGLVWHHLFEIPGSMHSPRAIMQGVEHPVPETINAFFHMAMMTAVPMLSVISGFLFFRRSELRYLKMLGSRFRTVALPTWIWSALWLGLGLMFYELARSAGWLGAPGLAWLGYFGNGGPADVSKGTLINGVFAASREPFAMQFWFVHDLIITILLAPVIHFALWLFGWRLFVPAVLLWLLLPDPPLLFSGNVPMFFTIGAWLALPGSPGFGPTLIRLESWRWPLAGLLTVALLLFIFSHAFGPVETVLRSHPYLCLLRVIGVLAIGAHLSRYVSSRLANAAFIERYSCYSFFIFAVHYPLIEILQFGVVNIPGHDTAVGMTLSWLLVPATTIALSIALAVAIERQLPAVFALLNGGRGMRSAPYARIAPRVAGRRRDPFDPAPDTR